jgi:hypothetical protein
MDTKCKPGDLAVVIRDFDGCDDNVGRIVEVRGPLIYCEYLGPKWLIEAKSHHPWPYIDSGQVEVIAARMVFADGIEHPDGWLAPIRGSSLKVARQSKRKGRKTTLVTT